TRAAGFRRDVTEILRRAGSRTGTEVEPESEDIQKAGFPAHIECAPMQKVAVAESIEKNLGRNKNCLMWFAFRENGARHLRERIEADQRFAVFQERARTLAAQLDGERSEVLREPRTPAELQGVAGQER